MFEQIERIKRKLDQAKRKPNPPLPLSEIEKFEKLHNIRLPEGYRHYLQHIGNGGAGPYTGLPLSEWDDQHGFGDDLCPVDFLSTPSAFTPDLYESEEYIRLEDDDSLGREVQLMNGTTAEEYYLFAGTVAVSSCGCGFGCSLIVSGPFAGRIVYLGGYPYFTEDANFLDWYERSLDEELSGYDLEYFGWGPPGDEAVLLAAAGRLPASVFLRAVTRFREPSDQAIEMIRAYRDKNRHLSEIALSKLKENRWKNFLGRLPFFGGGSR